MEVSLSYLLFAFGSRPRGRPGRNVLRDGSAVLAVERRGREGEGGEREEGKGREEDRVLEQTLKKEQCRQISTGMRRNL